jgi:hypothetical protein
MTERIGASPKMGFEPHGGSGAVIPKLDRKYFEVRLSFSLAIEEDTFSLLQ